MDRPLVGDSGPKSRRYLLAGATVAGLGIAIATWFVVSLGRSDDEHAWVTVTRGELRVVARGSGTWISSRQRKYSASESGVVQSVFKGVGDAVTKGDPILVLENQLLIQELEDAQIARRTKEIDVAEVALRAEQDVERARLAVDQAAIERDVAEAERSASENLLEPGVISRFAYEQVLARLSQKQLALSSAKRLLQLSLSQRGQQQESHAEAISLADLRISRLRERVQRLSVVAQESGVVKSLGVRRGDAVSVGTALLASGPYAPDGARILFPQRYLAGLKIGTSVSLLSQGKHVAGRIARVGSDVQNGQVVTEIEVAELPQDARIDMALFAEAQLETLKDAVFVPSLIEVPGSSGVLRVRLRRGGVESVKTLLGVRSVDGYLVFSTGLTAGDQISVETKL